MLKRALIFLVIGLAAARSASRASRAPSWASPRCCSRLALALFVILPALGYTVLERVT